MEASSPVEMVRALALVIVSATHPTPSPLCRHGAQPRAKLSDALHPLMAQKLGKEELETVRCGYDFDGQLTHPMTAHPKVRGLCGTAAPAQHRSWRSR